jgi:hypothetical protein
MLPWSGKTSPQPQAHGEPFRYVVGFIVGEIALTNWRFSLRFLSQLLGSNHGTILR